ncbi:putative nuclease HARBI1 [Dermacentor silvarum]|uniref:putative nuclease HARBI1 n=1 Tax=Dermacentor silvarum TaxID=543639 RepID=UPI002100B36E|nr:putative nuclease HARBI1 [Dermacentor silvarum]XP_049513065.1 putative nuclease HARBI1 [Dermacentor silvarum]
MASFDPAGLLVALSDSDSSHSSSSESSSSSDEDESYVLYEILFNEMFAEPPHKRPKIVGYVEEVVHVYSEEEFRRNFRVSRSVAADLYNGFTASRMCPRCDNGGSSAKTAEEHVLAFLWYAANKACIRDVAGRFGLGETTTFRVIERVMEYLVELAKTEIAFPDDIRGLAKDFEQLSGVPGVIGCIDGTYINIRCPARKVRSTYINRHNDISMTLQAVCDHEKRFLDVTVGNPSKMHDAKIYRNSRLAARLPQICASGNYHILGDAAYPLRQYLLTPYRDYGKLTSQQKSFNARFSATRVRIENAFGDLKARFRQLLHLDFFVVDKINVFVISCCVLHNLCIKAGVEDIPFDPEDTGSDCTWQRLSHDDRESSGPQTAKETVLRQMGEQKRESVRQKMGLQ